MKHIKLFTCCAALLFCTACSVLLADPKLVQKVEPSVVVIKTDKGSGSGFIVGKDRLVTNYHVIQGARTVEVKFVGNEKPTYKSDGYYLIDEKRDIAVISLKLSPGAQTDYMKQVKLAGSLPLKGSKVVAIGNPIGLDFSVSEGVVASIREAGTVESKFLRDRAGTWIQHDAAISSGNSGGPLFNSAGEVVGMNTSTLAGKGIQNLNFAISSLDIRRVVNASADVAVPLKYLSNSRMPVERPSEPPSDADRQLAYAKVKELIQYHLNADSSCIHINRDGKLQTSFGVELRGYRWSGLPSTIALKPATFQLKVSYRPEATTGRSALFIRPQYSMYYQGKLRSDPPKSFPLYSLKNAEDYWFVFSDAHSIRKGKILALTLVATAHLSDGILYQCGRTNVVIHHQNTEFVTRQKASSPIGSRMNIVCLIGSGVVYQSAQKKLNAYEIKPLSWFVTDKKIAELYKEVRAERSIASANMAKERLLKNGKANIYYPCKNKAGVTVEAYVTNVTETTVTLVWRNPEDTKAGESYLTGKIDKATLDQATLDWFKQPGRQAAIRQLGPRIQKLLIDSE